jgi:hypothetical protein
MYLTVGRLDELFKKLIDETGYSDSGLVADSLGIDLDVLDADIPEIRKDKTDLFFYKERNDGHGRYTIYIPEQLKPRAKRFLKRGGWETVFDEQHTRYQETEKEETEKAARQREKEELEMEVQRLQIADWPKMQRERKITRWIAIFAALISLVATVVALLALSE